MTQQCTHLQQRLIRNMQSILQITEQKFNNMTRALHAVSPLNTLNRGYAIVSQQGKVIHNSSDVNINNSIQARLADGELICKVEKIIINENC